MTEAQISSTPLPDTSFSYRTGTLTTLPSFVFKSESTPDVFGVAGHTPLVLSFAWKVAGACALLHLHLAGNHLGQVTRSE